MPDSLTKEVQQLRKEKRKAEKKDDLREVAKICNILGDILKEQGELEDAISEHESELAISEALDDKIGCAIAHRKIGECQCESSNFDEALKHQRCHLKLAKENNDLQEEQRALATIGRTFLYQAETLRDLDKSHNALWSAESAFMNSMTVCGKLQSVIETKEYMQMKARLLLNLGLVHDNKGNTRMCSEFIKRAIKISEMYSLYDDLYRCQFCLAGIFQGNDDIRGALRLLAVAEKCAQKLKDKYREGEVLAQKAMLFIQLRDFSAAKRCLRKAKKISSPKAEEAEKIINTYKTVLKMNSCSLRLDSDDVTDEQRLKLYETLGDCAASIGQYTSAVKFYMDMLQVAELLGKPDSDLVPIYVSLATTYFDMKQYRKATDFYKKELQCHHDNHNQVCRTWLNIAEAQELDGATYEMIKKSYDEAMTSAKEAEHPKLQVLVLRSLSVLQDDKGYTDAKNASLAELQALCEEYDINNDEDLSDSEDTSPHDEDPLLDDLIDSDSSDTEEEYDISRLSDANDGARCRRIRKIKVNEKGETPLHRACIDGKLNMVKALIEGGHAINPRDNCGWLPLHEAANYGFTDIVGYLLEHGARINDRGGDGCGGITPLHDACNCGNIDVIRLLVERGANVHAKDNEGKTPLRALMDYHSNNAADLKRQDIAELKALQQLLRRTMQGNNPHLVSASHLADVRQEDSEEDLPCIRRRPRRQHASSHKRSRQDMGSDRDSGEECEEDDASYRNVDGTMTESPPPATAIYRDAISAVGSVATRVSQGHVPSKVTERSPTGPVAALIPEEENIVDDWLIDDVLPRKRQRTDIAAVFTDLTLRKQHKPTEKHHYPREHIIDSDDAVLSDSATDQSTIVGVDDCSRVSQTQSRIGRIASRKSAKKQPRIDTFVRSSSQQQGHWSQLPSNVSANQQPVNDVSNDVAGQQMSVEAVMRMRINIQGKVILVPLMPSVNPRTIAWLAKEASDRYFKLFNLRPVLSLATKDGAMLSPDDQVISVFANNEEVLATVTNWDLLPLPTRYIQACESLKSTSYHNIRARLEACALSNDLDLHDLALRPQPFLPVVRALQCEHHLRELHLSGNRLGDNGVQSLCQIFSTTPNLSTLDLTCNEITHIGLKTFGDYLQMLPSDGRETPLKVLEVLNLSFNPLGDSCMLSLATALIKLPALSVLSLSSCDFTQTLFQHHRLALAESMQEHRLASVDFSSNQLASTGLELLLMTLNASSLQKVNVSNVVNCSSQVAKKLHTFVAQPNCVLEALILQDCYLTPDSLPDICQILTAATFLQTVDLSLNTKLNGPALATLLTEAARCTTCRLTAFRCFGCGLSSPLPIDFIDSVAEKLNHVTPLKELAFTCSGLTVNDVNVMKQIWTERWSDRAVCDADVKLCDITLTVQQDS